MDSTQKEKRLAQAHKHTHLLKKNADLSNVGLFFTLELF